MMKEEITKIIEAAMDSLESVSCGKKTEFEVSVPKRKEFGDFSTNAALAVASSTGENPRKTSEKIAEALEKLQTDFIEKIEIAGPGFINFFVNETIFESALRKVLHLGSRYGSSENGRGEKVLVEFVSANPTGYLHFGHARNAVVGDSVCRILSFSGYEVTKEFYINDAGMQMEMLGESVHCAVERLRGVKRELPKDGYRGDYIHHIAGKIEKSGGIPRKDEEDETAARVLFFCREFAYSTLLEEIKRDLSDLRVDFDNWYSERDEIHNSEGKQTRIEHALQALREIDALEEKENALWFRASLYGDDNDWVVIKKDGTPTYFLSDIAYHMDKYSRGFSKLINIWGADHHSHLFRLKASMKALGENESSFLVLLIQFVRLIRDGKEVSMSKRSGEFVTVRDVLSEVGCDATRFFLLMRSSDSHLDFDLSLAKEQSNENPVYYIQYANARISSLCRNSEEKGISASDKHLHLLCEDAERSMIKKILRFPETVLLASESFSPHKVVYYLQDIASEFHSYYNKIKIVDQEDVNMASARLYMALCIQVVIENGLNLLGINAPRKM